jgi:ubiquinone/menaquinone biosynthesis C-methylase UbiE
MDQIRAHDRFIEKKLGMSLDKADKLNMCCGYDYRSGWINVDINNQAKVDKVVNLNKLPLPFKDNSFDYIFSAHTIEHVKEDVTLPLMVELWRILKPRGILELRMPHFSHYSALSGFAHKRAFSINAFSLFMDKQPLYNVAHAPQFELPMYERLIAKLKHQRTDNGVRMLVPKNTYYHAAQIINKLADTNVNFCEKIWCYWVGGFQEMQIVLRKIDQPVKFAKDYHKKMNDS